MRPKSVKNRLKKMSYVRPFFDKFLIDFLWILDGFWKPTWLPKSIKIWKIRKVANFEKKGFRVDCLSSIRFGRSKIHKNRSKIEKKTNQYWSFIFNASWKPTWCRKPSQNPSKIDGKWISKTMKIFNAFWVAFWWLLEPTWPQNPSQTPPQDDVP